MLTEDYILRMINQAVAALLYAIGLRKAGRYDQAHQTIDQALEGLTGLRADLLENLDDQSILEQISKDDQIDLGRAQILADLFLEKGHLYEQQKQAALAHSSYQRALMLFLEIAWNEETPTDVELKNNIMSLVHLLPGDLPFDLSFSLFSYYEKIGEYSKAYQVIQVLKDKHPSFHELAQELAELHLRLSEKTDSELSEGGFSQTDIAHFRNRSAFP